MKQKKVFDMFNRELKINDRVQFSIDHAQHDGVVNFISNSGYVKINSLVGEIRRKGNNVIKM